MHNRESPLRVGNDLKDDHLPCSSITIDTSNIEIVSYKSFSKRKNRNNYALVGLL